MVVISFAGVLRAGGVQIDAALVTSRVASQNVTVATQRVTSPVRDWPRIRNGSARPQLTHHRALVSCGSLCTRPSVRGVPAPSRVCREPGRSPPKRTAHPVVRTGHVMCRCIT